MPSSTDKDFYKQAPGSVGYEKDHPAAEHPAVIDAANGIVSLSRKKIAVCGFASSSRWRIPVDDPEWSVWLLNQLYRHVPRGDREFDIHLNWAEDNVDGTDHPKWLAECGIPVFFAEVPPGVPTAVRYPVERLMAKFGIDYFTSTVAFMLALAVDEIDRAVEREASALSANGDSGWGIAQKVKALYGGYTIGIFGIDLIVGQEWDWQKACVEFWLGQADARGIMVLIPPESALLKQMYRYGYQREPDGGFLKISELRNRQREIAKRRDALLAELRTLDGALQESDYYSQIWELRSRGGMVPVSGST